jgi:ribosome-binding factor A
MAKHSKSRNESLMLRYLSEIIAYKVGDPALGLATVTAVEITNDYSYAKVYVSFLGSGDPQAKLAILSGAGSFIRHELAQRMNIRKIPELRFMYDDTLEKAQKIDELLKKAKK